MNVNNEALPDTKKLTPSAPVTETVLDPRFRVLLLPKDEIKFSTNLSVVTVNPPVSRVPFDIESRPPAPVLIALVKDQPAPIPLTSMLLLNETPLEKVLPVVDPERKMSDVNDLVNPVLGNVVLPCKISRVPDPASVRLPDAGPAMVN